MTNQRNVYGDTLEACSMDPVTGYLRNGMCETGPDNPLGHMICVEVTEEFLMHQATLDNELRFEVPAKNFPGLKPGDRWCVIAEKWLESYHAGIIAPVVLRSTNYRMLELISLEDLERVAI